jgi:hypothetical protein
MTSPRPPINVRDQGRLLRWRGLGLLSAHERRDVSATVGARTAGQRRTHYRDPSNAHQPAAGKTVHCSLNRTQNPSTYNSVSLTRSLLQSACDCSPSPAAMSAAR